MPKPALYFLYGFFFGFIGAVFGGLCGLALTEPFYRLTNPQVLQDGQFGMIYLATVPFGALIGTSVGAFVGVIIGLKNEKK